MSILSPTSFVNYIILWILFAAAGSALLGFVKRPPEKFGYWIGFWARTVFLALEGYWIGGIVSPLSFLLLAFISAFLTIHHLGEKSPVARQIRYQTDNAVLWLGFGLFSIRYIDIVALLTAYVFTALVGGVIQHLAGTRTQIGVPSGGS